MFQFIFGHVATGFCGRELGRNSSGRESIFSKSTASTTSETKLGCARASGRNAGLNLNAQRLEFGFM